MARSFAKAFGPSSSSKLVASAEIGNEPGHYDDDTYRAFFRNMAEGLREGDPKLKIGTCALTTGKSEQYAKSVDCVQGLEGLYDFLNIHTYAEVEGYPTWRRSYPEDPKIDYLRRVAATDRVAGSARTRQGGPHDRVRLGRLDQARTGDGHVLQVGRVDRDGAGPVPRPVVPALLQARRDAGIHLLLRR